MNTPDRLPYEPLVAIPIELPTEPIHPRGLLYIHLEGGRLKTQV